ncbi:MAG TPA: hypothetical protein VF310_03855 [Vicinamibacteria bacterium]
MKEVSIHHINLILQITDSLGIHRESVMIPLGTRHPGRIRRLPNGKFEIVVESEEPFEGWLGGLEAELRKLLG